MSSVVPPGRDEFDGLSYMEIERRARAMQARYAREAVGRMFTRLRGSLRRNAAPHGSSPAAPNAG